jgi:hypothetical protein
MVYCKPAVFNPFMLGGPPKLLVNGLHGPLNHQTYLLKLTMQFMVHFFTFMVSWIP